MKLRERVPSSFFISYCLLQIINGISSAHTQLPDVGRKNNNKGISPRPNFFRWVGWENRKVYGTSHLLNRFNVVRQLLFGESIFRAFPLIFSQARTQFHENGAGGMGVQDWLDENIKSQKSCYVFLDPRVCVINIFAKMSRRKTFRISLGLLCIYFWHFSRS